MVSPHSSVNYVEPNIVFDREITNNSEFNFEKIINPEDYCIALKITVERYDRRVSTSSEFITLSWNSSGDKEKTTRVNFMSGTLMTDTANNNNTIPYMTTKYADMYVTDLVDYGTSEMLGIKSVNIEFESAVVPVITVQFSDVRGMSLFTPTEMGKDSRFVNKRNVEQSFFQAFFQLPYPKFNISVKGFYGNPVSYEVTCDKFDTNFNSETGNFDVTARFIGYRYSFLSDISMDLLLAAPYAKYLGEEYWNEQKANGHFAITDVNGNKVQMPTMVEIMTKYNEAITKSQAVNTTIDREEATHEDERRQLSEINKKYHEWYTQLAADLIKKYGKDLCIPFFTSEKQDEFVGVLILVSREDKNDNLSFDATQFSDNLKTLTNELNSTIKSYNESYASFNKLDFVSEDFSSVVKNKLFNPLYVDVHDRTIKFNGFHVDNKIHRALINKYLFPTKEKEEDILRKIYNNDGVKQFIDCFYIDVDYTKLTNRISYLEQESNASPLEKQDKKQREEFNRQIVEELGWSPTIENFTKISMAHLETLMHMLYTTAEGINADEGGRTPSALGVSVGADGNCSDVREDNKVVPPFPRVTKLITEADGTKKQEDCWIGEFNGGSGFGKEIDLVETFFNAVAELRQIIKESENRLVSIEEDKKRGDLDLAVPYPITSFDFFLDNNVYGEDVIDTIENFAGAVSIRMFDVLCANFFANNGRTPNFDWRNKADSLGKIEAHNFFKKVNSDKNKDFRSWIKLDNGKFNSKFVLDTVKSSKPNDRYPWSLTKGSSTPMPLINTSNWFDRYQLTTSFGKCCMYPLQNISFNKINEDYSFFQKNRDTFENHNVALSIAPKYSSPSKLDRYNAHYNFIIEDDYMKLSDTMGTVLSTNTMDEYKTISDFITDKIDIDKYIEGRYSKLFSGRGSSIHESFVKKLGITTTEDIKKYPYDNQNGFYVNVEKKKLIGFDGSKEKKYYTSTEKDLEAYLKNEIKSKSISSCFISEIFGNNKETKKVDYETSLLGDDMNFTPIAFLMGINCINYRNLEALILKPSTLLLGATTFNYIPRFVVLQIGLILDEMTNGGDANEINNSFNHDAVVQKLNVFNDRIGNTLTNYINKLSVYSRYVYIKYYRDWVNTEFKDFKNQLTGSNKKKHIAVEQIEQTSKTSSFVNRIFLREDDSFVRTLTNKMMLPVMIINGNVNHIVQNREGLPNSYYRVDESVYKKYLDAFISELNQLYGMVEFKQDDNGNIVRLTTDAANTTNEMRMELYRYLKQINDKWLPTSTMEDWYFNNFFDSSSLRKNQPYRFYFIDSYYNKIGNKLMLDVGKIVNEINVSFTYPDVNMSLYGFFGKIFGDNRCMFKCVQNFFDLKNQEAMANMFKPLSYNTVMNADFTRNNGADFVVVYTYEPSKYLNVPNSDYKDDGFMLNDEFYSPISVRSRGADDEGKNFYKIPAFGVTYGKQYQSFFKNVSVGMGNSIQTQQAIQAKHNIINAAGTSKKTATVGQDLFDIYANQSYTCKVDMMGCAWVQPMMYFVLLNIPMFKGSYMIMKVSHTITPGNMSTTFTGCRMSNVSNKLVENIFVDVGQDENGGEYTDTLTYDNFMADVDNDCPYKVYPVFQSSLTNMSANASAMDKASSAMTYIMGRGYSRIAAAGICGNIMQESTFDEYNVNPSSFAAGLCQWNPSYHLFKDMYDGNREQYGHWKGGNETGLVSRKDTAKYIRERSFDYQLQFAIDSIELNKNSDYNSISTKLKNAKTIEEAVSIWMLKYENPREDEAKASRPKREKYARDIYNATPQTEVKEDISTMNEQIYDAFFNAVNSTMMNTQSTRDLVKGENALVKEFYPSENGKKRADFVMMFKCKDANVLTKVFDCILNTQEYFKYVNALYWVANADGDYQALPFHIDVNLSPKEVQPNKQTVRIVQSQNVNNSRNNAIGDSHNENLLKSLGKKRQQLDDKTLTTLVPQLKDLSVLDKFSPKDCSTVGSALSGLGGSSKWAKAVQIMGKWYEKNVIKYGATTTNCPLIGGSVRNDCSGYVSACLQYMGVFDKKTIPSSAGFTNDQKIAQILEKGGFRKLKYSWAAVEPYDIISYRNSGEGHVEILAEKGASPKSWGWGSVHDCQGKHACMPANTGDKPKGNTYTTIWRYMG